MNRQLLGLAVTLLALTADQASKKWGLFTYDIDQRQPVAWNRGISYSLFTSHSRQGRLILLAVTLAAVVALSVWLWRARTTLTTVALGLLIGGALGNAYDRYAYGAVADFIHFHAGRFTWYVFNGADVGITAGVVLLIWESFFRGPATRASKMP